MLHKEEDLYQAHYLCKKYPPSREKGLYLCATLLMMTVQGSHYYQEHCLRVHPKYRRKENMLYSIYSPTP